MCVLTVYLFSSSLPRDNFVSVDEESLSLLLHFSLATGDVNSILDCLQILLGQPTCLVYSVNLDYTSTTRCITDLNYVSSLLGSIYTLLCHQATWIGTKLTNSTINGA